MSLYHPSPRLAGPLYGKDPWPLRFFTHFFGVRCHNTLSCSVIYDGREFGTQRTELEGQIDNPSGPEPSNNWREGWEGRHFVSPSSDQTFPGPVQLTWTSLDNERHVDEVDLDEMFKDRLVLHATPKEAIVPNWLEACSIKPVNPSILLEVDDRAVRVYMRATLITVRDPRLNHSGTGTRFDLVQAWERAY
jgi:hypothetical protein